MSADGQNFGTYSAQRLVIFNQGRARRLPVARALPDRAGPSAASTLHRLPPTDRSDCLRRVTGSRFPERPPEAWLFDRVVGPGPVGPPEACWFRGSYVTPECMVAAMKGV